MKNKYLSFLSLSFVFVLFVTLFSVGINKTFASNLVANSNDNSVEVGKTFTVTVSVVSPSVPINAVSGKLTYPSDLLAVTTISTSNSIINLWAPSTPNGPKISNGAIFFEGGSSNIYKGSKGKIFSVTFKAKKQGNAQISFNSVQIYAPSELDSTNVAETSVGTTVKIIPVVITPAPEKEKPIEVVQPEIEIQPEVVPIQTPPVQEIQPVVEKTSITEPVTTVQFSFPSKIVLWMFGLIIFLLILVIILLIWVLRLKFALRELKREFYSHRSHKI